MNFKWDKKYLYWGVTAFLTVAAATVFFLTLSNFSKVQSAFGTVIKFLTPITYGFVLAYLLSPVMNFFEKNVFRILFAKIVCLFTRIRKKPVDKNYEKDMRKSYQVKRLSRGFGVAVTMLIAVGAVVGLLSAVLPQLITTVQTMSNSVPLYITTANKWLLSVLNDYPEIYETFSEFFTQGFQNLKVQLQDMLLPQMTSLLSEVSSGLISTVSVFFNLILGFIICIYFLYSKELFAAQGKKLLYGLMSRANVNIILRTLTKIHKTFGGFITGKLIDAVLVGLITFIVISFFNMPYALLVSIFVGAMNVIPYFGPFIGVVPSAFLILLVDPVKCLQFVIIMLIIQQIDGNVIEPKILGDNTGLSSFWVIFAILAGEKIFGFVGFVIGVPLFAVFYALVRENIVRRLKKKGMPTDTNEYREILYFDKDTGEPVHRE